jgi:O-acetyl-ADP-ribose deacetylase (regulator of RNase III)
MRTIIAGRTLELVQGDITDQRLDAIVNAANRHLAGGGGVDGAIHRRGGPAIMEDTRQRYPQGCPTGSAVISAAGNLPAKYVIHAVGPVWRGGRSGEADLLRSAYRTALELARSHECRSVALPALSAGAYGYPLPDAAQIALATAADFLQQPGCVELVRFVLYSEEVLTAFAAALRTTLATDQESG